MEEKNNLELITLYFELAFKKGDFEALSKLIATDAKLIQAEGMPFKGTYIGFQEWGRCMASIQEVFELCLTKDPVLYNNPANNTVVALTNFTFKVRKSGRLIDMPIAEVFEVENGLIQSLTPYYFDGHSIHQLYQENKILQ